MGADVLGDNEFVLALRMRLRRRGVTAVGEIVDHALVVGVAIDRHQLLERQRMAPRIEPRLRLLVPEPAQAPIAGGEVGRERGVEHDLQHAPGRVCAGPQQGFEFPPLQSAAALGCGRC